MLPHPAVGKKERGSVANLWQVFLDDSGDEKKQQFIALGSMLGDKAAWNDSIRHGEEPSTHTLGSTTFTTRNLSFWAANFANLETKSSGSSQAGAKRQTRRVNF